TGNRHYELPLLDSAAITYLHGFERQQLLVHEVQDCQVTSRVGRINVRVASPDPRKSNVNLGGIAHHVVVGEDQKLVAIDDDTARACFGNIVRRSKVVSLPYLVRFGRTSRSPGLAHGFTGIESPELSRLVLRGLIVEEFTIGFATRNDNCGHRWL